MIPRRSWLWLFLLVPLLWGAARLKFDAEILNLLPALEPVEGLRLYQEHFADAGELVISVAAPDAAHAAESARSLAEALRAAPELVAEATWQPPWLEHPAEAAEFAGHLWLNQPPELFSTLTNRLASSNLTNVLQETHSRLALSFSPSELAQLSYDPYGLLQLPESASDQVPGFGSGDDLFAAPGGEFRLVFVEPASPLSNYREVARWFGEIRTLVEGWQQNHQNTEGVTIRFTGRPAFFAEIAMGMERDMILSVGGTAVIIALLFWSMHRQWRPMVWLLVSLVAIVMATLAIGGLVFGALNVVSTGFAAILLGLSVDYGMVLYQEHLAHPDEEITSIRTNARPAIAWSALTTGSAFLLMTLSGLPGLGQLGFLVAVGIIIAALTMLYLFLPIVVRIENRKAVARQSHRRSWFGAFASRSQLVWIVTLLGVVGSAIILWLYPVQLNTRSDPLRPRDSEPYAALEEIENRMQRAEKPLWIVLRANTVKEMSERLSRADQVLARALASKSIESYRLPTTLWPNPEHQRANTAAAAQIARRASELVNAAQAMGFSSPALTTTTAILDTWRQAAQSTNVFWPTNMVSRWIFDKVVSRGSGEFYTIGFIYLPAGADAESALGDWGAEFPNEDFWLTGWELLGSTVFEVVKQDTRKVAIPLAVVLVTCLWFAFGSFREVILSLAALGFAILLLLAIMSILGWSWNLLNLMALPLILGAGVDYGIHMQLGLRRHNGDVAMTERTVGRALFLCAASTVTAFGSLAFSGNAGLASLGQLCAAGVAFSFLVSVLLLPVWWRWSLGRRAGGGP